MKLSSPSQHNFAQVPRAEIQRSSFNRASSHKTTFNAGLLIPVYIDEVLPGDTHRVKMTAFARLNTPIFPIMDNMRLTSFFFFVPNRLVWSNWQKFNGEQTNPGDSTSYLVPTVTSPASVGWVYGDLYDYFGCPTTKPGVVVDNFWGRAYNLVWNTWFRDQNMQLSVNVPTGDGPDTVTDFVVLRRGKRHDYFTSSLTAAQKGTAVSIPLGGNAPVVGLGVLTGATANAGGPMTGTTLAGDVAGGNKVGGADIRAVAQTPGGVIGTGNRPQIFADLSAATAATINQLRQAFQIQRMYERDMRGGTRYTEILKAHFGVTSPDARLQRPEYLGGGTTPVNISAIAQQSANASQPTPLATLSGIGTVAATEPGHGFTKSFVEHGVIIGLVCVDADLTYQQGLNRMFSRQTRFDFYWPALAHLGEQAVLNQEIYCQGSAAPAQDIAVFGYQERFAEYRYKPSIITGKFRSNAAGTLDAWHLAENFASLPALGATFIQSNPPINRVVAVPAQPHFNFDSIFENQCARPMPMYGVPGLIDHF